MIKYSITLILSIITLLALQGCTRAIYTASVPVSTPNKISMDQMNNAVLVALQGLHWRTIKQEKGAIIAQYNRAKIMAKIKVDYSPATFSISYVDSQNLKYDGQEIHRTYNNWVKNLERSIQSNIFDISRGVTIKPESYIASDNQSIDSFSLKCENTLTMKGTPWDGQVFNAEHEIMTMHKSDILTEAADIFRSEGTVVNITDLDAGLIKATETTPSGKLIPIELKLKGYSDNSILATMTVRTPVGITLSRDEAYNYICSKVLQKLVVKESETVN